MLDPAMPANRPIIILTTGDPVPTMKEKRGPFAQLIQERIGDAWTFGYAAVDVRTEGDLAVTSVEQGSVADPP